MLTSDILCKQNVSDILNKLITCIIQIMYFFLDSDIPTDVVNKLYNIHNSYNLFF